MSHDSPPLTPRLRGGLCPAAAQALRGEARPGDDWPPAHPHAGPRLRALSREKSQPESGRSVTFDCPLYVVLCNGEEAWHANWKDSFKGGHSQDSDLRL